MTTGQPAISCSVFTFKLSHDSTCAILDIGMQVNRAV